MKNQVNHRAHAQPLCVVMLRSWSSCACKPEGAQRQRPDNQATPTYKENKESSRKKTTTPCVWRPITSTIQVRRIDFQSCLQFFLQGAQAHVSLPPTAFREKGWWYLELSTIWEKSTDLVATLTFVYAISSPAPHLQSTNAAMPSSNRSGFYVAMLNVSVFSIAILPACF